MASTRRSAAALKHRAIDEFNKNRIIEISNIPPSTDGELRSFLGGIKVKKVKINETQQSALVTLEKGEELEQIVDQLNNQQLKDSTVSVKSGYSGKTICVAHFPLTYTEDMFRSLCEKYGQVEYCYILRSEFSGSGKGYGVVEYADDIEQCKLIKSELDWQTVDSHVLHADFLDQSCLTNFDQLQSRCLLITNMPESFVDVSKLRELYGCVTSPVYCQIIARGDKSLGYGIVEFRTTEEAEQTWEKMKNEKIEEQDSVVTFCIPGKSAVVINNRIMWKHGDKLQKSSSLLPDPVAAKPVIAGNPIVMSLTQMNPRLMGEFTKVLGELQQAYVSQMMSPINKPGLLGPAPSLPLSPMMNPNMQIGLMVMLAIHIQSAKKEQFKGVLAKQLNNLSDQEAQDSGNKPSILGDPMTGQASVILTSLKQQLNQVAVEGVSETEPVLVDEKIQEIIKKFVANGRYLNLSLLTNLGQLLVTLNKVAADNAKGTPGSGKSLLGPMPGSTGVPQPLMGAPLGGGLGGKGGSLLGDAPMSGPKPLLGMGRGVGGGLLNTPNEGPMGMNMARGMGNAGQGHSLLNQISQGLMHQMTAGRGQQQLPHGGGGGRGLLGDMPKDGPVGMNKPGIGGQMRPQVGNQPGGGLMGNQPGGGLMGNQPGGGLMGNQPGGGLMGNQPGGGLMGNQPGGGLMGNQPGGGLMGNQPGGGLMGNQPGGGLMGNKPGALMGNKPGTGLMGNQPGAGLLGNQPGAGLMGNQPGAGLLGNQPGTGAGLMGNQSGAGLMGNQPGSGLMGNSPMNNQHMNNVGGNFGGGGSGASGGKSLLGEPPAFKPNPGGNMGAGSMGAGSMGAGSMGAGNMGAGNMGAGNMGAGSMGPAALDQGSWKSMDSGRWGSGNNYESGYGNKTSMGGGYNDYGYGNESYGDMSSMGGGSYGGYGDGSNTDYYYNQQQQQFGSGYGSGSGMGGGNMGGSGGFGMGTQGSAGVNYQDGQGFGKQGNSGLGQDNNGYGGDGYGGGMGGMGSNNYGYGGRDDYSNYDSYGSAGMDGNYSSMGGSMSGSMGGMGSGMGGMGNSMGGMGSGMGGMGNSMGGMGNSMGSGMGNSMSGMGSGMNSSMSGMGSGSMGMGNSMSGMGSGSMGMGNSMSGMGSGSMGGGMSSGMGSGRGMGGVGNSGMGGMNDSYNAVGMSASSKDYGSSLMGNNSYGSGGMGKMGMGGDQSMMGGSFYQNTPGNSSSNSGLLPPPTTNKFMTPPQKRSHSQLPKPEASPDSGDYIGQHSQGLGGHYQDSYKRPRLY